MLKRPVSLKAKAISRRTALKALGVGIGAAALEGPFRSVAHAGIPRHRHRRRDRSSQCFIYLDHAAREEWVLAAVLVRDPRWPRQLLRRAKRARLPRAKRPTPEIAARQASDEFKQYFYHLLARQNGQHPEKGLEIYGIHLSKRILSSFQDREGLIQLRMVSSLLEACQLARFREVFVYYNLPSVKGVSRKGFRTAILHDHQQQIQHPEDTRFEIYRHRAVRVRRSRADTLVDEGIQVAGFAVHALFQKHQYQNLQWFNLIRPVVRNEIDATQLSEVQRVRSLG